MHQGEWDLPYKSDRPQLIAEKRPDSHRYRVIRECCGNAEQEKILNGCLAVLEKEMRRDTQAAIANSRYDGPHPPSTCYQIKENDTEKPERKAPQEAVFFGEWHHRREHGLEIGRSEWDKAKKEDCRPADQEFQGTRGKYEFHGIVSIPYCVLSRMCITTLP